MRGALKSYPRSLLTPRAIPPISAILPIGCITVSHAKPFLIVQAGAAPDDLQAHFGDIPDWFCHALDVLPDAVQVVRPYAGEALPDPATVGAAVITGSWAMVTDRADWSERTAGWIRTAMDVEMPLLGVCYGHQLMAHALGGNVDYHPAGIELGRRTVSLLPAAAADEATRDLPASFQVNLTHMQTEVELAPGSVALAASDHDPHQIVRVGPRALSVHFHPEFRSDIMAAVIKRREAEHLARGLDVSKMLADVGPTPPALQILRDVWSALPSAAAPMASVV